MAAINFQDLFNGLKDDVITLARASFKTFTKEAEQDAQNLLEGMKDKLSRWTALLAEGSLSTEDFELLINAQKDLVQMKVLQQAGLAIIRIEQFRDSVIHLITDTIFHALP
jgi:hypothetical protein